MNDEIIFDERENCTNCIYHRKAKRLENHKWIYYSCCVYFILKNPKLIDSKAMILEEYDKTKEHFYLCECFVDIDKVKEIDKK